MASIVSHLPIGFDATYAEELARFDNLYVRVGLKGASEEEFSRLTGAMPEGYSLQLKAIENLYRAGVRVQPAMMTSFSTPEHVAALKKRLAAIAPELAEIETEELVLCGDVAKRLERTGIRYIFAHEPDKIPPEQV